MRITQKQIPQFRLELPVNNTLAVPRLGNVQLRFHFLRRGTSVVLIVTLETEGKLSTQKIILK